MKKTIPLILAYAVLLLFFIQTAGTLVESVYILDLMHTSLDAKALGVLAFLAAILLLPFRRRLPVWVSWLLIGALAVSRGLTPHLPTLGRLYSSTFAVAASLLLAPAFFTARTKGEAGTAAAAASAGLGLAVGLSVLLRSVGFGLDYSLMSEGGWAGWVLAVFLVLAMTRLDLRPVQSAPAATEAKTGGVTLPIIGIFLVLALVWFAFSAPSVISRWTEGSYLLTVGLASLLSLGWAVLALRRPDTLLRLPRAGLAAWNGLFLLSLVGTILAHRVPFPASPQAVAVVASAPTWLQQAPLVLMLILFPVLFVDMRLFVGRIAEADPSPRAMVPGMLLGGLLLVVLVFINVFTNVWGYIDPISTPFRNQFWLPFGLAAAGAGVLAFLMPARREGHALEGMKGPVFAACAVLMCLAFLSSGAGALVSERPPQADPGRESLLVMTYNIQAGNDKAAERAFDRQIAVIRRVSPDIVALQESDTARLGLNNSDCVRYFAARLGCYAWYGPTTVTGTFGTAILSRYPMRDTRSAFSFSDTDEIGTAEAVIQVGGRTFTIHNVHPDGSPEAMMAFARNLLDRTAGQAGVIVLGDCNMRETDEPYKLLDAAFTEAWASAYPSRVGPDGQDMSRRIDHILVSRDLGVRNPTYLLPPESATDHPVHWAEVTWGGRN